MKKVLLLVLSAALLIMAACGGQGGGATTAAAPATTAATTKAAAAATTAATTAAAAKDAPMEISMMNWDAANSFSEDGSPDRMLDFITEKFNIKITPIDVGWDDASEKSTTWAAAGTLPDVIGAQAMPGSARYYQWISDGVVRALPDDLSAYPQVKWMVGQREVQAYTVDGKNYFMPRQTYGDASWWVMDRGIINRKDWREKLGIAVPKTEQDFIDMWAAFSKSDPNGDGSIVYGMMPCAVWIFSSQCFTTFGYTDGAWTKMDDGSVVIPTMEKSTLPLMSFLRRAYAAGGVDPDFVTAANDVPLPKFASGKVGTLLRQVSPKHLNSVQKEWTKLQPDKDLEPCLEVLHPPEFDGAKTVRFEEKAYWSETYINSNVKDDKMARILEFYDFMYTDEATRMMIFGFEGEDFKLENGEIVLLTEVNPDTGRQKTASDLYRFCFGGLSYLVSWPGDLIQYEDPSVPKYIRDLTVKERDYRIANWESPKIDYRIGAIDVPEKSEMSGVRYGDDWAKFITDTSGASDSELYEAMYANWEVNGYKAAKTAMTKAAADRGY